MKIYEDTRQQKGKHDNIKKYCDQHGITIIRQKLDEGDYMLSPDGKITIDTKYGMQEMYNCVVNDKSRFMREVRRCYEKRIKLVVLVEHGPSIKSLEDVPKWKNKYGKISSREIMERLYRLHISYGVEILFCSKQQTGKKIIEILTDGVKTLED